MLAFSAMAIAELESMVLKSVPGRDEKESLHVRKLLQAMASAQVIAKRQIRGIERKKMLSDFER